MAFLTAGQGNRVTSATPDSGAITTTSNGDLLVCAFWGGVKGDPDSWDGLYTIGN